MSAQPAVEQDDRQCQIGDKERQRLTWGHEEHFTEEDFREMCPDYWSVSRAYEDFEEYQEFRDERNGRNV